MTSEEFRNLACAIPGTIETAHMKHPDFRLDGVMFASLAPRPGWAELMLTSLQQLELVAKHPDVFSAVAGARGRRGATRVCLENGTTEIVKRALLTARKNISSDRKLSGVPARPVRKKPDSRRER